MFAAMNAQSMAEAVRAVPVTDPRDEPLRRLVHPHTKGVIDALNGSAGTECFDVRGVFTVSVRDLVLRNETTSIHIGKLFRFGDLVDGNACLALRGSNDVEWLRTADPAEADFFATFWMPPGVDAVVVFVIARSDIWTSDVGRVAATAVAQRAVVLLQSLPSKRIEDACETRSDSSGDHKAAADAFRQKVSVCRIVTTSVHAVKLLSAHTASIRKRNAAREDQLKRHSRELNDRRTPHRMVDVVTRTPIEPETFFHPLRSAWDPKDNAWMKRLGAC